MDRGLRVSLPQNIIMEKKFQLFVMLTIVCIAKELGNLNSDLKIKDENPVIATDIILIDAQFCKSA